MVSKALVIVLLVTFVSDYSYGQRDKKFFRKDYTYIDSIESFYKIHTLKKSWFDAKRVCAQEGASLFYPENDDEAQAVISFWNDTQPFPFVYVGISDLVVKGVFETINGHPLGDVYHNWGPGEPNDANGVEDCVTLRRSGYLNDGICSEKNPFICKKSLLSLEWNQPCNIPNLDGQKDEKFFRKDYTYIDSIEGFYKIHTLHKSWFEAKQVCAQEGASLFYPENEKEAQAVISLWKDTQPFSWVYVGISDLAFKGVFETINGNPIAEVYHNWGPGEPSDANGVEDCVILRRTGYLNDANCNDKNPFICKKSLHSLECNLGEERAKPFFRNDYSYVEAEENFYKIHTTPRTWTEAKRVCALEGATLWHPDNDDEAHAVISFWNTTQPHIGWVYVGMSDLIAKGLFETLDGKSVSEVYNHWQPGQPDGHGGKQDCVYIYKGGLLDDWDCDYKYSFICKKSLQSLKWNDRCNIPDPGYTFNEENGKCYKLHKTPMNWNDSYAVCRLEQSHLAVITNQQEADYLVNLTESTPNPRVKENYQRGIYHVGFHNQFKEGWQTVKGTPINVDADVWWDSYLPADDRNQCGSMFYTGRLIDTDCDMKSFFICEHEPANSCTELVHVKNE